MVIRVIVRFTLISTRILQFMLIFKLIKRLEDFAAGSLPVFIYIYTHIYTVEAIKVAIRRRFAPLFLLTANDCVIVKLIKRLEDLSLEDLCCLEFGSRITRGKSSGGVIKSQISNLRNGIRIE